MSESDPSQLRKLVRFRKLLEDRASLSMLIAVRKANETQRACEAATRKMNQVSEWKGKLNENGVLQVGHYEYALAMEQKAALQVAQAMESERTADFHRDSAQDACRLASNATRVAEQRHDRTAKGRANRDEHRLTDEISELWLGRNFRGHA